MCGRCLLWLVIGRGAERAAVTSAVTLHLSFSMQNTYKQLSSAPQSKRASLSQATAPAVVTTRICLRCKKGQGKNRMTPNVLTVK